MLEDCPIEAAHRLLSPRLAALIGSNSAEDEADLIPVTNVTSVSTNPEQIAIAIYKEWNTHANLSSAEGFTVSIPTASQLEGIWRLGAKYSGFEVGSPTEKLRECGLEITSAFSPYGPVCCDSYGWLEARTVAREDFGGDHGVFVAEVIRAARNPRLVDEKGVPSGDPQAIFQYSGNLFCTNGELIELDYLHP